MVPALVCLLLIVSWILCRKYIDSRMRKEMSHLSEMFSASLKRFASAESEFSAPEGLFLINTSDLEAGIVCGYKASMFGSGFVASQSIGLKAPRDWDSTDWLICQLLERFSISVQCCLRGQDFAREAFPEEPESWGDSSVTPFGELAGTSQDCSMRLVEIIMFRKYADSTIVLLDAFALGAVVSSAILWVVYFFVV